MSAWDEGKVKAMQAVANAIYGSLRSETRKGNIADAIYAVATSLSGIGDGLRNIAAAMSKRSERSDAPATASQ